MFKFKKKTLIYLAVVVGIVFSLSFSSPLLRIPILNSLRQPLNIILLVKREISGIIFFHRNLIQNELLRKEIGLLKQKLIALDEAYLENKRLKKLLSLKQEAGYRLIAAKVIARSADSWSCAVIIDKGNIHGIKRGMAVISHSGLVGKVIETTGSTAKIMLISDPSLGVSAIVQRSRQEGLVCGTLGTLLMMKYLPEESDIIASDVIITSGLTPAYPKGIAIGSVVEVSKEFSGLSCYALIKPAANLSNIEEVLVIVQ